MQSLSLEAESAVAMEQLAAGFAQVLVDCGAGLVITLQGPLGAGKTTWCRGLLRALGYQGVVKSPTYTLVESYKIEQPDMWVHHFDLYRMVDPEELEYIGGRDYFDAASVCLVEWPERGERVLPPADIGIDIRYAHAGQDNGRCLTLTAQSAAGHQLFSRLRQQFV